MVAHLLGLENVHVTLGSRPIISNITLGLSQGERVGVVGPNGGGKSTLLRLISADLNPDEGRVTRTRDTVVAVLTQQDSFAPGLTVVQAIHPGKEQYEWAADARLRDIHDGLLAGVSLQSPVDKLSGGQRRRVALAAALSINSQILILDEPTNHLDVEGIAWLAAHLQNYRGALVTVTHDRWFLDAVCNHIWEVVPGHDGVGGRSPVGGWVEEYDGGYAAYVLARAERLRQASLAEEKRQNLLRKELAWLRRGAPARTSKPRFRIEAAEALIANVPPPRDSVSLAKTAMARLGKDVLDVEEASFCYNDSSASVLPGEVPGEGQAGISSSARQVDSEPAWVLRDTTWRLAPGERVGVVGANGAGKSTLLKILSGEIEPTSGRVKRGKTVRLRVLSQDTSELDEVAHLRVVEAVAAVRERIEVGKQELSASQLVERLGFTRERAWTAVADISGGERRRLQIMRILMDEPNVLLLDEPTNDLDTDTLAAMEDILDEWPGTLVVVSHDRYFLERLTDHQVAILGEKVLALPGGVEQYLQLLSAEAGFGRRDSGGAKAVSGRTSGGRTAGGRAPGGRTPGGRASEGRASEGVNNPLVTTGVTAGASARAANGSGANCEAGQATASTKLEANRGRGSAHERMLQKELGKLLRQIEKLSVARQDLGERMTAESCAGNFEVLAQLGREDADLQTQIEQLETRWLEVGEELEKISTSSNLVL